MTAGIFARHGAWTGRCKPPSEANPRGFFENVTIKRALIRRYGKLTLARDVTDFEARPFVEPQPGFRDEVEQCLRADGYEGGPWLVKVSALYRSAFDDFPEARIVGVRRRGVVEANLARREMMGRASRERVERMVALHDREIAASGAPVVDTDAVVGSDYETLRSAFAHCGMAFDRTIADEFVEPSLWHH